jgi:lipoprotein NlpD
LQIPEKSLLTVVLLALMAGCSSPRPAAPIFTRTAPPAAKAPAGETPPTPPAASSGSPAQAAIVAPPVPAAAETAEPVGVQAAPVRGAGVEVRPLDAATRPAAAVPAAPVTTAPPAAPQPAANVPLKLAPKGLKRPYSDAVLAEVIAADGAGGKSPGTEPPKSEGGKAEAGKAEPAKAEPAKADAAPDGDAPFAWPAKGRVVQGFAEPKSLGLTIEGKLGDPVQAAADGRVIFSGPGPRGYGNLLIVKHDSDTVSVYAHNKALLVKEGQTVKRGQRIAELGDAGTDKPALLFEIRKQGKPVDPQKLLPKR